MTQSNIQDAALARLFNGLAQLREIKARQRKPKVSDVDVTVAVMSYNNAAFIGQTVESVLAQEGVRLELLVFDDCSPDDSLEVLERYRQDPRFSYKVNPRNMGMIGNYNQCLHAGSGRYVVVLGSDDVIYPGHLRSLVEAMDQHSQVALGYTQCLWINEHGQLLKHAVHPGHRDSSYVGGRDELVDLLTHDSYITPSAAIFRRSALPRFTLEDGYVHRDEMLAGDWELWTRIAQAAPDFLFLHQATVGYRIHGGQISQKFYASDKPLAEHTRILELNLAVPEARRRMQQGAGGIWQLYLRRLAGYPSEVQARFATRKEAIRQMLFEAPRLTVEADTLFSVILTTFNRPRLLVDALDSLANQTWKDFEVILVNDKGAPVESLLDDYAFPITYLRQGRNQGPAAARNAGHRLARGRYVVYLDDDDLYLPHHLQTLAEAIERHPGEVVYTDAVLVTETLEGDARVEQRREQRYRHGEFSKEWLFYNNYIPVNTFACPRELIGAVGGLDEQLPAFEDWDLLMRLALRASFRHVRRETVEARMRAAQSDPTRRSDQAFKDYPALYQQLYARHWDLDSDTVRAGRHKMLVRLGLIEEDQPEAPDVQDWFAQRALSPQQRERVEQRLEQHGQGPRFGILVLDLEGSPAKVAATQASLARLAYGNVHALLLTVAERDTQDFAGQVIQVTADNWMAQLNQVLTQPSFDWFCLLDAGDEMTPAGLLVAGLELLNAPDCRALYCDGLYRQNEGQVGAVLRPDFNLDYLLSLPASMGRHWLLRRDVVVAAGGFDTRYRQSPEFELILRLIDLGGLDGLGHIAEPLLISDSPQLADVADERNAITRHLHARGYESPEVLCDKPGQYRIRYGHRQQPLVSILILAGSDLNYLQRCVESVLQHTRHRHYELLLIESDPAAAEVNGWLNALAQLGEARLRPLGYAAAHANPATALNSAAEQARGDYLLLLSPRAAVYDEDWLDEMLNHAQRPEVGAVGAKLLSADGKISHAGLILGLQGPAGRPFVGMAADAPGYMQRIQVDQNYSAVSGECLLIARELYQALDGLSEAIPARYQDVDLCLRARQAGYLNVWAANAQLLLSGQVADAAAPEEEDAMYEKWLPVLARDTAYNPNLSLIQKGGFQLAGSALSWRPLSSWKPLPTVLAHPADLSAAGHCRVVQPFTALQQAAQVEGALSLGLMHLPDLERYEPDSIILQREIGDPRLAAMHRMKTFSRAFKVFDLDLYLPELPVELRQAMDMPGDIPAALQRALGLVDRLVVPTASLAEAFSGLHKDIQIIESRLPVPAWASLQGQRRAGQKPRVGLVGGAHDGHDLLMLREVVKALAGDVEWVLLGVCPEPLRPYLHELHGEVPAERYPALLAALNLDLVLAPREQNALNEHKDNLPLLEFGACGYPVICSDVRGYRTAGLPVTRVGNQDEAWLSAIRMHLDDLEAAARLGDDLQAKVRRDWMLDERHLDAWRRAWLPN
ncbi:glycosyltransferase [Pseudomonas entomophila]|uniref:glycosyltransferase n=1 Tax=Pseudomonas entomophila TaxID=312306 RepID=UPI0023D8C364|nr:glycosyltransferase [Pseudomonas entomophila]MDF0731922.1 glycosyltransferase [Pseudomonas entomophila]